MLTLLPGWLKGLPKTQRLILLSVTMMGISHIVTQILVMREFLNVFYGNELVFGIILSNWLLLTGLGCYLGGFLVKPGRGIRLLIVSQVFVAIIPVFYILAIRAMPTLLFVRGELLGVDRVLFSSLLLLAPYCLLTGFLLVLACELFKFGGPAVQIGRVYLMDNIGDILGGFLFSFIFVYLFNPFQTLLLVLTLNMAAAIFLSIHTRKTLFVVAISMLTLLSGFILLFEDLDTFSTRLQFKGQELVWFGESPFGKVVVTKLGDQLTFFENRVPLFSTENTVANEETVHYAMVQHPKPRWVLLISGGVSGTLGEILKYGSVEHVDYVELDPLILEVGERFTDLLGSSRVEVHNMDGRLFVKRTGRRYDVIIVDLPDPETAQINRFFTLEFFNEIKKILNEDGVFSISLSPSGNYVSQEKMVLNSSLYKTLRKVFSNVIVIPGGRDFFLASNRRLSYEVGERLEEFGVETRYVNKYYLDGILTPSRLELVMDSVRAETRVNRDLKPITYYYYLRYWTSQFQTRPELFLAPFLVLLPLIMVLTLLRGGATPLAIFTTGFAGAGLEVVLLIGFQILYGYVYHGLGVVITAFMVGLALGAAYMNRKIPQKNVGDLVKIEFGVAAYSFLLPFLLVLLKESQNLGWAEIPLKTGFPILTAVLGILVGLEFPLASKIVHLKQGKNVPETASLLYSADLVGACIGAILVSTLLIPILGITMVCFLVATLNLASMVALILLNR